MVDASVSDLYVVPLYKTAFLNPFDPSSLDFICRYLDSSGGYAAFAPDNILLNAHAHFQKSTGFSLNALGELEFYLLAEPESHIFLAGKQRGYHASAPFIKSGKLVPIVVAAPARVKDLPDTPTFKEVGLEPVNRIAYYGILAPKGTSKEIVDKLNAATRKVLEDPAVKKRIADTGSIMVANTPEQFAQQIKDEFAVYKEVVAKQKLTLD